jgi:hypothetical protein
VAAQDAPPAANPPPDRQDDRAADGAAPAPDAAPKAARLPARARGAAKAAATLTVTLTHVRGDWTVAAHQGTRVLAKPTPVRPGDALRMVAQLDLPGVRDAVEQIVAGARAEAEREVERLRAELVEIEARLAELPQAP